MTFGSIPECKGGKALSKRHTRRMLGIALSLAVLLQSIGYQALAASKAAPVDEPMGTLLLPLTPKLDDGASPAFDRTPPDKDSTVGDDASSDSSAPAKPQPHQIRATTADLKPPPEAITPETGEVADDADNMDGDDGKLYKGTVQIVADDTEFDQDKNTFLGTGNAVALIGGQNSKLEADTILYNQTTQEMDARGNVRMLRDGQLTTGSAFKFKVTSDEYLITDANTEVSGSEIVARKAFGANKGVTFKDGTMLMQKPFYMSRNAANGPLSYREGISEKQQHPDAFVPPKPSWTFKARKIDYEKYKEEGNLTIYGGKIMFGNFGIPLPPKFVATIGGETKVMFPTSVYLGNNLMSGGTNFGPAFNTGIGKTGVFMWSPMIQYGGQSGAATSNSTSKIGLAGQVAFTNAFMGAHFGYGSVSNLPVGDFKVRLRKQLKVQLGLNRYLDDGMFGTRRARLMAEVVDNHPIKNVPFMSSINFRTSAGWAQDNPQLVNQISNYGQLFGSAAQSTKMNSAFKIQEQMTATTNPIFSIGNSQYGLKTYMYGGVAARGYSTGQSSVIAQAGPVLDAYLGKVRFQTGYTQSAVRGSSPFVFDQFIQGTQSVFLTGDVKVCKYLTVGGGVAYNMQDKLYTAKTISAAIGPDDFKLLVFDSIVQGNYKVGFDVLYGQPVPFQKLVLKNTADQGQLGGI